MPSQPEKKTRERERERHTRKRESDRERDRRMKEATSILFEGLAWISMVRYFRKCFSEFLVNISDSKPIGHLNIDRGEILVLSQCRIQQHMKSRDHLANDCTNIHFIIDQFISR